LGKVIPGESAVGGGSLPGEVLPTALLALDIPKPNQFLKDLRLCNPPVIGRIQENQVVLDPRTVLPDQDNVLLALLQNLIRGAL
jgi:L-seryl-tRNA(Ser) seleniumtransferase